VAAINLFFKIVNPVRSGPFGTFTDGVLDF